MADAHGCEASGREAAAQLQPLECEAGVVERDGADDVAAIQGREGGRRQELRSCRDQHRPWRGRGAEGWGRGGGVQRGWRPETDQRRVGVRRGRGRGGVGCWTDGSADQVAPFPLACGPWSWASAARSRVREGSAFVPGHALQQHKRPGVASDAGWHDCVPQGFLLLLLVGPGNTDGKLTFRAPRLHLPPPLQGGGSVCRVGPSPVTDHDGRPECQGHAGSQLHGPSLRVRQRRQQECARSPVPRRLPGGMVGPAVVRPAWRCQRHRRRRQQQQQQKEAAASAAAAGWPGSGVGPHCGRPSASSQQRSQGCWLFKAGRREGGEKRTGGVSET